MSDSKANLQPFVRDEMVEARPAPVKDAGAVNWVRTNLFSSWFNILLTLAGFYIIWVVLQGLVPWLWNTVWDANSLSECREVLAAKGLSGSDGACFAVIRERWNQILYGFYPNHLYWRPNLSLVVLLTAAAPVLFPSLPRKMLILTAVAPFLIYWLIWGGTIWGALAVAAGFVIGALVMRAAAGLGAVLSLGVGAAAAILWWSFAVVPLDGALSRIAPIALEHVGSKEIGGFTLAILLGVIGIILSLPLGIVLALGRKSEMFIISAVCTAYIEIIRGVPLIVWLSVASLLLNYFLPPGTNFDLFLRVSIMVTVFSSAYMAEVIRGGLAALPRGQYEAADALGLDYWKSMRLIILPQALKISIPAIVNTFLGLFKDTTLVFFIGMYDPLKMGDAIRAATEWHGIYWEIYIFVGLLFFICCYAMSRYSRHLEERLKTDHD